MERGITYETLIEAIDPTAGLLTGSGWPPDTVQTLTLLFILALGVLFVIGLRLVWASWHRKRILAKLNKAIAAMSRPATDEEWLSIGESLERKRTRWLSPVWQEFFEHTWVEEGRRRNHEQAEMYFTPEAVDPQHHSARAMPSILTAMGIQGTFLGVTLGLLQLEGIESSELESAISSMVVSLGLSFRTSIYGLVLSIGLSLLLSRSDSRLEAERIKLVEQLNARMPRGSVLEVTRALVELTTRLVVHGEQQIEQGRRQNELAEEQKAELQLLGETIGQKFEEAVFGKDGHGGLVGVIQDMTQQVAGNQSEGVDRIVDDFLTRMDDTFGQQFTDLGGSIQQMVSANSDYQQNMAGLVDRIASTTAVQGAAVEHMQSSVEGAQRTVDDMRKSIQDMAGAAAQVRSAADAVGSTLDGQRESIAEQQLVAGKVLEALHQQAEGWTRQQEALDGAYAGIQQRFDSLSSAIDGLVQWHDRIRGGLQDQHEKWEAALRVQHELTGSIREERTHTTRLVDKLGEATGSLDALGNGLQALAARLEDDLEALMDVETAREAGMKTAASQLQEVGAGLGSSFEEYARVVRHLSASVPDVTELLTGLTQSATHIAGLIERAESVGAMLDQTVTAQERVHASLTALQSSAETTTQAFVPAAQALNGSAATLGTPSKEVQVTHARLAAIGAAMTEAAKRLETSEQSARGRWEQVEAAMRSTTTGLVAGMNTYSEKVNTNLQGALGAFDQELSRAVGALGQAITGLQDTVEVLEEINRRPNQP